MHRYQPLKLDQPESGPLRPGTVACHWLKPEFVGQPLNEPAPPLGSAALKAAQDQWIANIRAAGFPSSDWHQIDLEPQRGATGWLDSPAFLESWIGRFHQEFPHVRATTFYPMSCPWPMKYDPSLPHTVDALAYQRQLASWWSTNYPWLKYLSAATFGLYLDDPQYDDFHTVYVGETLAVAVPFFHSHGKQVFFETTTYRAGAWEGQTADDAKVRALCRAAVSAKVNGVIGWFVTGNFWTMF